MMSESPSGATGHHVGTVPGRRVVSCALGFEIIEPAEIVLQLVAATSAGRVVTEQLDVDSGGTPPPAPVEVAGPHGARIHVIEAPRGRLAVTYRSEIEIGPEAPTGSVETDAEHARLTYLRPSRYCPSDHLVGFAVAEFAAGPTVRARVQSIADWIRRRVSYVAGSSSVHDSAEDTLLTGVGTCRDFAHLGIALCRAIGIPARFASVYAPGLFPMDFHAVFETLEQGRWITHDATDLAPRTTLVRIATGRDAADAAFASVNRGIASFDRLEVTATVAGNLPADDPSGSVRMR
jgi:transglutaminase-like putative cysteine protease